LRGNTEKELILQDLTDLHSTVSWEEFDSKFSTMFSHWLVRSSEFALYFYHQWVQGDFVEWQIFHSTPGIASTNNAVESLNASIKKYFTRRKRFKLGKFYGYFCVFYYNMFYNLIIVYTSCYLMREPI
jgi:hypothetical protein